MNGGEHRQPGQTVDRHIGGATLTIAQMLLAHPRPEWAFVPIAPTRRWPRHRPRRENDRPHATDPMDSARADSRVKSDCSLPAGAQKNPS